MANCEDDRAVVPVVGKLLEVSLVVLYLSVVSATLYGGVVPGYEAAAGEELGERTLAMATQRIEAAVPPNATRVEARYRVALPETIAGDGYAIRTDGRTLVLDHPDPPVETRARLELPPEVVAVEGSWTSGSETVVTVTGGESEMVVELREANR